MIKGGPKIIDDSLVVCLDAHDAKSYAGEPTQNYVINTTSTGGWNGDGSSQTGLGSKGAVAITDENLKYNGYDTVLWTPGTSRNCYLNGSADIPTSETSTEWTFSAYVKYEDGSTISSMSVYMYYPSSDGSSAGTVTDVGGGWFRVRRTRTGSSNYISLAGFTGIAAMKKIYISGWQLEKKQYTTPVTSPATSRSATDGWKDLSTNDHDGSLLNGTNTGVNYYRDGQVIMPVANSYLDFDGTDDQVIIPSLGSSYSNYSLEFWIAQNGTPSSSRFYSWNAGGTFTVRYISSPQSFQFHYNPLDGSPSTTSVNGNSLSDTVNGIWHHVVVTNNSSVGAIVYTDGVAGATGEAAVALNNGHILGTGYAGINPTNCKIAKFNIYNTDLTAAEILSNYNATKNRFT